MPPDSTTYPQHPETAYVLRDTSAPSGSAFPSSSATIFKYNPHRMSPAEVLDTFVGREELLARLITHIRSQKGALSPKHVFLHGPRGIGKTTMLLALRYTLGKDPGLSAGFDVVQFSEEERRITNLPSFAIRALELISGVRPEAESDLAEARNAPANAFGILMKSAARRTSRPVLLLLDNFDDLAIAITSAKSKQFDARKTKPQLSLKQCGFVLIL